MLEDRTNPLPPNTSSICSFGNFNIYSCLLRTDLLTILCIEIKSGRLRVLCTATIQKMLKISNEVSCCQFWIYWVGVNTIFTTWQLCKFCIYTHPVNSKFTTWQKYSFATVVRTIRRSPAGNKRTTLVRSKIMFNYQCCSVKKWMKHVKTILK